MKIIYLFFVGLILSINSHSQVSQINKPIMHGGTIRAFAKSQNCVLVGTEGGVFKSTNEGQTWTNASKNFNPYGLSCEQIINIGSVFYAKTNSNHSQNIYKSTDDGLNWTPLTFPSWWPQSLGKLSETLYMVGNDFMSGDGRLYSSTDGTSWTPRAIIWTNNQSGNCELFHFSPDKLYVLYNDGLYYTTNGNVLNPISKNGLGSAGFSNGDNEVDGDISGNLYFKGNNHIYKYDFTLETWSAITSGKIPAEYFIMDFSATDNALFVTAMSETLGIKLYRSTDQGVSFSELTSTGLAFPMINNIFQVSANGFIGNSLDDKILLSSDGGSSWASNANQYIASFAGNLTRSGNSLLYAREVTGLIRSVDQGLNWNEGNTGIPGFGGIAYFINEITQVRDTLFSFVQVDPFSNELGLYKSVNFGASWASSPIPAPYNSGKDYSFAGTCGSRLFVNYFDPVSSNFALINTSTYGSSWAKPSSQNNNGRAYLKGPEACLFTFFSHNNDWEDFDNVYRANSYGLSFSNLNPGIFQNGFSIKRVRVDNWDKGGPMMDFDQVNNKAIFVVRDRTMGNDIDKLYLYNITSAEWSNIITTGLPSNSLFNCIFYNGNNVWLLATNTGLYKSTNGGVDWAITHITSEWQNGIIVNSIQIIENKAILGTVANGVWTVDLSVSTGIPKKAFSNDLQLFPNPTDGLVDVIIPDFTGKTTKISLYSFDGREIMSKNVNSAQLRIDMHDMPSGSYFIIVNADNQIYRKVIIRK